MTKKKTTEPADDGLTTTEIEADANAGAQRAEAEPAETELNWDTIQEIADAAGDEDEDGDRGLEHSDEFDIAAEAENAPANDDGFPPDAPAPTDVAGNPVDTEGAAEAGYEFNAPPAEPAISYSAATVKSLSTLLIAAGLSNAGNKPELYARAVDAGLLNAHHGRPTSYTVEDETHYSQVAAKFNIANYRELGALNGVKNSRYELNRGDVVTLPVPKRG